MREPPCSILNVLQKLIKSSVKTACEHLELDKQLTINSEFESASDFYLFIHIDVFLIILTVFFLSEILAERFCYPQISKWKKVLDLIDWLTITDLAFSRLQDYSGENGS